MALLLILLLLLLLLSSSFIKLKHYQIFCYEKNLIIEMEIDWYNGCKDH